MVHAGSNVDAAVRAAAAADPQGDAQAVAEAARDRMFAADAAAQALGLRVTAIAPGRATVTMTVRADMLNGFAICHGGLIGTLADTAFAYACNTDGGRTVASGYSIDLLAPAREGDALTANATVVSQAGRTGVVDVDVDNARGERIAVFRGRSYRLKAEPAA